MTEKSFPTQAQVVIIGGGVIGCSVAYHLTKLGWRDVVLLEQTQLTAGTTWHAAGLIVSGFSTETDMHMAKYTRDLYERLGEETGQDTGFKAVGYMQIASNPERLNSLRRRADTCRAYGVSTEEISAALDEIEADAAIGCSVITGSERAFAAGADIKEMSTKSFVEVYGENLFADANDRITAIRKPIVRLGRIEAPKVVGRKQLGLALAPQ